nr:DUF429 domain-containing protein [Rhodopirellula sp. JC740]
MVNVKPDNENGNTESSAEERLRPQSVFGVDFSGAAQSGKNAWLAELEFSDRPSPAKHVPGQEPLRWGRNQPQQLPPLTLVNLQSLGTLAESDEREQVCAWLSGRIVESEKALWGMDFPFGLPIELGLGNWRDQLRHVAAHEGDAKSYGRSLVELAESRLAAGSSGTDESIGKVSPTKHIRRQTDRETQTPFDCYHYRIIYQTFHGMRDVLQPLAANPSTAVMPFQCAKMRLDTRRPLGETAWADGPISRVVVEACPSSTLKRMGWPHQQYKQPDAKEVDSARLKNRQNILLGLKDWVRISLQHRAVMLQNPGGDALDAVLAGLGAWLGWQRADHKAICAHKRYPSEGFVYC